MVQLRRTFKKKLQDSRAWRTPVPENTSRGYVAGGFEALSIRLRGSHSAFCRGFPLFFVGGPGGFLIKEPGFGLLGGPVRS